MKNVFACLFVCSFLVATNRCAIADDGIPAPPEPDGMKVLFDGESLEGWSGDPRLWSVRDGVIHGETTPENSTRGNTFLIWQGGDLADFELRLSFRCNATNNSGVQYRSKHLNDGKASNDWVVKGYQHEIRNEIKMPNVSGFIYDEKGKRGRLCLVGEQAVWTAEGKRKTGSLITASEFSDLFHLDDWNDIVIIAKGNHIQHFMNGRKILDFTDEHPELSLSKGVIALQLHGGKPMWAEYKNIRVKEL